MPFARVGGGEVVMNERARHPYRANDAMAPWRNRVHRTRQCIRPITQPEVVRKILTHLGLPTNTPALELARGPPDDQLCFDIDDFTVA